VHIRHKEISVTQVEREGDRISVHYDSEGKLALYGMETEPYRAFVNGTSPGAKRVFAMRNKRASL